MVSDWQIQMTARQLLKGAVIAYPTEGVWGLGCDPWQEYAVSRILQLKQRPMYKGLILIAGDIQQFEFILHDLPQPLKQRLEESWPGANTWLVPHNNRLPHWITGEHATVALRVTDHPLVRALCQYTGPIVSTSANPAGRPAAKTRLKIEQYFHAQLDAVLNGELGGRQNPSLIRDLISGAIVRPA